MQDGAGITSWVYDGLGRVTQRTQTTGTVTLSVGYAYDSLGHLASVTTPSGRTIALSYTSGRVSALAVNGVNVLQGVTYAPFGPTRGWQWGNGASSSPTYDTDGQLVTLSSAGASTFTYFPDGLIKSRADDFTASIPLPAGTTAFAVSSTSNRLQTATGPVNRSYSYDAAGNTLGDGSRSFTYDDAGRHADVDERGRHDYVQLQRAWATREEVEQRRHDLLRVPRGRAPDRRVRRLRRADRGDGVVPVATLRPSGSAVDIYYVHTDHLNTPRRVTDSADNTVVWRWDSEPYGATAANEDPDGDSTAFTYNLRFPGQYRDAETGLNYNYFRDYDAVAGRYVESDPIGLGGGLNTYAYVDSNPISRTDAAGLMGFGGGGSAAHPQARVSTCEQCQGSDRWTIEIENTPCSAGDAMCGIALRDAGFSPPYYPHTLVLSKQCLATAGLVGKPATYVGSDLVISRGIYGGARLAGASVARAFLLARTAMAISTRFSILLFPFLVEEVPSTCECKNQQ
jgi:RHS repeat-associated protein